MKALTIILIILILNICNISAVQKDIKEMKETEPRQTEPAPTAEPDTGITGDTKLYFCPDGGTQYHLDPDCQAVNEQFRPMQETFTAAELNDEKYIQMDACPVCGAPERK